MSVDKAIPEDEFVDVSSELERLGASGSTRVMIRRSFDSPGLRACLADPDRFLSESKLVKNSRTTTAGVAVVGDGVRVFIKRYNDKGLWYSLRYALRPSRPFRSCQAALLLESLGVPTPTPLAASSTRVAGLALRESHLIVTAMDRLIPTLTFYETMMGDESIKEEYLDAVAGFMARLHDGGLTHGDLKLSNVYVIARKPGEETARSYGLWDLDATRRFDPDREPTAVTAELARFASSFVEIGRRTGRTIELSTFVNRIADRYRRTRGMEVDEPRVLAATRRFLEKRRRD